MEVLKKKVEELELFKNFIFIFINDYQYFTDDTYSAFQICLIYDWYIPRFCYHPKLNIAGNCRMCFVEEIKSLKPVISCALLISEEISIYTETQLCVQAREDLLELILINHPLDCPICDQGGECDL